MNDCRASSCLPFISATSSHKFPVAIWQTNSEANTFWVWGFSSRAHCHCWHRLSWKGVCCNPFLNSLINLPFVNSNISPGGSTGLIILRALQGLCQGITYPALNALLAVWIPLKERSKYGSLVYGGSQVGTILGTSLASVLLSRFGTWHAIFYCFGTIGVVWFILFTFLCSNDPDSHPFIKEEELVYLKKEIGSLKRDTRHHTIPWKEIVSSAPVLAMIAAEIGHGFSFYVMVSDLPKYLADVLRFSPRKLGVISSLPFVCMWIVCLISGILCDWLIATKRMSNSAARKWFTGVGAWVRRILESYP